MPDDADKLFRVMIADSDPLMRDALKAIVSGVEGFSVTHSVGDLNSVVGLYKRDSPDIVIIDMAVPWLTGLDIAKEILDMDMGATVFTISEADYYEIARFLMGIRLSGHITKPVSVDELRETLSKLRKSARPKASPLLSNLSSMVLSKDFRNFYRNSEAISTALREESGNSPESLNLKLKGIHQSLNGLHGHKGDPDAFPAFFLSNPNILSIESVVELCLFNIMDSVFKRQSVSRHERLSKVFQFLERNIAENIGLCDLVNNSCMSQGNLSRTFKRCYNLSVMEYIHIKKISLAKAYLLFTEYPVSEVSALTGYNERSYFGKVFKKFEQKTIKEYCRDFSKADALAALSLSESQRTVREIFGMDLI
ncbi:MAG: response regulator [Deltaproteobacteria bacterium]|jgi:two-component system response regulator YesN|nr:response regulator [Deltaproteobacteria bacterium]